jgi:hypothetical protein
VDLTPRDEHDLWVGVFTSALSESAFKLATSLLRACDDDGACVTAGDVAATAANLADEALGHYREIWGIKFESTKLTPEAAQEVVRGLEAGLSGHMVTTPTVLESSAARQCIRRALRLLGAPDHAAEEVPP